MLQVSIDGRFTLTIPGLFENFSSADRREFETDE